VRGQATGGVDKASYEEGNDDFRAAIRDTIRQLVRRSRAVLFWPALAARDRKGLKPRSVIRRCTLRMPSGASAWWAPRVSEMEELTLLGELGPRQIRPAATHPGALRQAVGREPLEGSFPRRAPSAASVVPARTPPLRCARMYASSARILGINPASKTCRETGCSMATSGACRVAVRPPQLWLEFGVGLRGAFGGSWVGTYRKHAISLPSCLPRKPGALNRGFL